MRPVVRDFLVDAAGTMPLQGPVLEIGARPADGQEELAYLRDVFSARPYVGCDIQPGRNVDAIEDIHRMGLRSGGFGTVVCAEVLEHVHDPIRAVEEIHRVLRPGGVALLTSVMFFPIHEHPWDYWRFTPEGFLKLLDPFETKMVVDFGYELLPEAVFAVAVKGPFEGGLRRSMFPRTERNCSTWGDDLPVDFGPIRMTTRFLLRATVREAKNAAVRRARGAFARNR